MKRGYVYLILLVVFSIILSGCDQGGLLGPRVTPTPDPCSPGEVQKYYDAIKLAAQKFDDAATLANSTPRMSLPPQISELQAARRDAENLKVPSCATKAQQAMVDYMNAIIDGFTAFLAQESDSVVNGYFATADTRMSIYESELAKLVNP